MVICIALADAGLAMFLVDAEAPGWRIERVISALARSFAGHYEISFDGCRVEEQALLGAVGQGFHFTMPSFASSRLA